MTLRCKQGDLALVIHEEESCRSNIGKFVRVAGPVDFNPILKKHCWLIEPVNQTPWCCINLKEELFERVVTFADRVEHPDEWLLPIDPKQLEQVLQTEVKTLENA
jgi:hypothetical protein